MSFQIHRQEWELIDSVLVYCPKKFTLLPNVLILDLENCIIKKISKSKIYHKICPREIVIYDEEFLTRIKKISETCTIVLLVNAIDAGLTNVDLIKTKYEITMNKLNVEYLAFFATMNNRFSKPHTGMYQLLKGYFHQLKSPIDKAMMISNNAGRIIKVKDKLKTDAHDTDRAFASNCGIIFQTVDEFMGRIEKEDFSWNNICLPPEFRIQYLEKISEYQNPSVFKEILKSKSDLHIILLWGAPKCGKTTYAINLIKAWDASDYGENHAIVRLGLDIHKNKSRITKTKKLLSERISVIIDGYCHTKILRQPYEQLAQEFNANIIYIELNPGIYIADFFNHWAIETSQDIEECVVPESEYRAYNGYVNTPPQTLIIVPDINFSPKQLRFRY